MRGTLRAALSFTSAFTTSVALSVATAFALSVPAAISSAVLKAVAISAALSIGLATWVPPASAQDATPREVVVGYLTWADDPRYDPDRMEADYPRHPAARPRAGAELALQEAAFALTAGGYAVRIEAATADDVEAGKRQLDNWARSKVPAVVLDLPADWVTALASHGGDDAAPLLFNATATDDELRGRQCHPRVFHVVPSERMHADAAAQLLAARRWSRVLVLQGPDAADQAMGKAWTDALRKFGLKVQANRPFKLSNDPRERDLANVALLTSNADYDAVVVADADGEFARGVPFHTILPRPVLGGDGIVAQAWQPRFERFGAPQLSRRFMKANGRPMSGWDWSTWMAMKSITQALVDGKDASPKGIRSTLRRDGMILDGFKGTRLGYRPWDQQLRQPVFLSYGSGIAGLAPFDGFLHQRNVLDTLGVDQPESACKAMAE